MFCSLDRATFHAIAISTTSAKNTKFISAGGTREIARPKVTPGRWCAFHPNGTSRDSSAGDVAEVACEGGHTGSERIISADATQWCGHVDPQEV